MDPIETGIKSQLLKDNSIFKQAVEELRGDLYNKWVASNFSDSTNREELYRLKVALELVMTKLDSYILQAENKQLEEQDGTENPEWGNDPAKWN